MALTMSPLAPNIECTVTPGLAFLNAAISAVNGVSSVPAPNTTSVPCDPEAAGLAPGDELELLQAAANVTIRQAAAASPPLRSLRPTAASLCIITERGRA